MKKLFTSRLFWAALVVVWIVGFAIEGGPVIYMMNSKLFSSTVRVQMQSASDMSMILSSALLHGVAQDLNLKAVWTKKMGLPLNAHVEFDPEEILQGCVAVSPVKNSNPPEANIVYFDDSPQEAARVANGIADAFVAFEHQKYSEAVVLSRASADECKPVSLARTKTLQLLQAALWACLYGVIGAVFVFFGKDQFFGGPIGQAKNVQPVSS